MTHLVFALPDGRVCVSSGPAYAMEPEPAWLDRVSRKCCPEGGKLVAVVSADELPSREHRDAWVWDGQRVVVDESRIRHRPVEQPQAVQHQTAPADTAPIRAELQEEIASVRKDFSAAVERTFRELDQRIKE